MRFAYKELTLVKLSVRTTGMVLIDVEVLTKKNF